MTDLKERLRTTATSFGEPRLELDRVVGKARAADRRRRASAGATAFVVAIAGLLVLRPFGTDPRRPGDVVPGVANGPIAFLKGELSGSTEGYEIGFVDPATGASASMTGYLGPGQPWSPDGSRIAYVHDPSDTPPGDMSIWTAAADGTDATKLTSGAFGDFMPQWSPGGSIMFLRNDGETIRLMLMDADGSDPHPIAGENADEIVFEARWSPDGAHILTMSDTAPRRAGDPLTLAVITPDGAERRVLFEGFSNGAQWSADGSEIYFVADGQLQAVRVADGTLRVVSDDLDPQGLSSVRVSPDGHALAFTKPIFDGDREELWVVNVDGTEPQLVADHLQWREPAPDWAPDGTAIAFVRGGDIWTVDVATGAETRITASPTHETIPSWGAAST